VFGGVARSSAPTERPVRCFQRADVDDESTSIRGADEGDAVRERFQQSFKSLFNVWRLRGVNREPFERRRQFALALAGAAED
jgi:hypothetical protein